MHANEAFRAWPAVVAVLVSAVLCAAPAAADASDDAFVAALAGQNIPVPDPAATIQLGRNMCAQLDQGTTRPVLAMMLMRDANLTAKQAGFFLGASASAYCPQYRTVTGQTP